jgi:hypothetical protein
VRLSGPAPNPLPAEDSSRFSREAWSPPWARPLENGRSCGLRRAARLVTFGPCGCRNFCFRGFPKGAAPPRMQFGMPRSSHVVRISRTSRTRAASTSGVVRRPFFKSWTAPHAAARCAHQSRSSSRCRLPVCRLQGRGVRGLRPRGAFTVESGAWVSAGSTAELWLAVWGRCPQRRIDAVRPEESARATWQSTH